MMHQFSSISRRENFGKSSSASDVEKRNFFFKPILQPKLAISQSNDKYEQEADAMVEKVIAADESSSFFQSKSLSYQPVQRKCTECEEEEIKLQLKPADHLIQRQDANEEEPDPLGEGLSTVAENLGENNPAFSEVTADLANRFLSQPAPISIGIPVFLGANYAFMWGMALANPSMRHHLNDFNLAMLPGAIPQFPIKTFTYRLLNPEQTQYEFDFGLDGSALIALFNEGVFNTHISTLSFEAGGNLGTETPSLSLSSMEVNLGFFDNGILLSGGFRQGVSPYPLFTGGTYPAETGRIMQQVPGLPDLYPGQQDIRFMLQVDVFKLYNYFNPQSTPIHSAPLQIEGDRVE